MVLIGVFGTVSYLMLPHAVLNISWCVIIVVFLLV